MDQHLIYLCPGIHVPPGFPRGRELTGRSVGIQGTDEHEILVHFTLQVQCHFPYYFESHLSLRSSNAIYVRLNSRILMASIISYNDLASFRLSSSLFLDLVMYIFPYGEVSEGLESTLHQMSPNQVRIESQELDNLVEDALVSCFEVHPWLSRSSRFMIHGYRQATTRTQWRPGNPRET